jgi:hypothetical protein
MRMSDRLEWKIEPEGNVTLVELSGPINEDSDFDKLLASLQSCSQVRMDLAGINRINSCGVREWVNFVRAQPGTVTFEFENLSPPIVNQVNMISNFTGSATILSVQAPFFCTECNREARETVLVEQGKQPLPTAECPQCGSAMEFDDFEDSYFAFLAKE